jgi:hypothetical protein
LNEKTALEKARGLSDFELHKAVNSKIQMSEEHIAANLELECRERKHRFWRQDLVAWLALGLSIISLVVSALT